MNPGASTIPIEARLDPDIRRALDAMVKGEPFDTSQLVRLAKPEVSAHNKAQMTSAQAWVVGTTRVVDGESGKGVEKENADCLECGVCCQQGWRVDVKPSDIERMSPSTITTYVVTATTSLRIIQTTHEGGDGKKCAAQTTYEGRGCGIYEERPEVCRTFPKGHERCVVARVERGLTVGL